MIIFINFTDTDINIKSKTISSLLSKVCLMLFSKINYPCHLIPLSEKAEVKKPQHEKELHEKYDEILTLLFEAGITPDFVENADHAAFLKGKFELDS